MAFSDNFVGVPQSRWAGYAILAAIIAVSLAVLFGKERVPLGTRVLIIVFMFLIALPTIALVLFQLTCLVTGTKKAPYCGWYAWVIAAITIVYCVMLIFVSITSKMSDQTAIQVETFADEMDAANQAAGDMLEGEPAEAEPAEAEPAATPEMPAEDDMASGEQVAEGLTMPNMSSVASAASSRMAQLVKADEKEKKPAEKKPAEKKPADLKKKKEYFADYGFSAAPVAERADMYML